MLRRTWLAAPLLAVPLAAPALGQARTAMTIATGVDPSFAAFYVAKETGIFERNGLDVTINTGPSGSAMIAFLIGNQINAAYGAEQAGISAHLVDPNVVAVAEGVALTRWMSVLGRGVADMDALRGRRIGVARGTGSETFWLGVIASLHLNPADYTVVNVEAPEMVAALERGNIDAFAIWEPWPTRALRAIPGTSVLLTNENRLMLRNYVYVNRGWATANAETTARFLRSLVQATAFMGSDREASARAVARFLRLDRALVADLMTKVDYTMNLTPDSVAAIQVSIDQLRGMGRLARETTPADVIWTEPLRGVAPERVLI